MSTPIQISSYHDYHLYKKIKYDPECVDCQEEHNQKYFIQNEIDTAIDRYIQKEGKENLLNYLERYLVSKIGKRLTINVIKGL